MIRDDTTGRRAMVGAVLAIVTLAAYWPTTQHGFIILDDPEYVRLNPMVQQGLTLEGLLWAFTSTAVNNWHPLTWLSHMLDCQLFGLRPGAHHLVSVLLHAANTVLLFHLLRRLTGALWPSAGVAALFAWHPLHVKSVAWLAERKDVLSAFFWILTLLAYLRYVERPRAGRYLATLALFVFGLLAKPMLVTLPCVMLLLDFWPLRRIAHPALSGALPAGGESQGQFQRRTLGSLCLEKAPFLACALAMSVVTYWVQHPGQALNSPASHSLGFRLVNAVVAYFDYLTAMFWPVRLGVFYPLPESHPAWKAVLAVLVLGTVSGLAVAWRRSRPYWATGWLWYLGTLVPVIGLIQVGDQARADRYTYLPMIGVDLMIAWGLAEWVERRPAFKRPVIVSVASVAAFWILLTGVQVSHWKDNRTLFGRTLAVTGRNYVAETVMGKSLTAEGKLAEAKRLFQRALEARPTYAQAHFGLGDAHAAEGKLDEAVACYQRALQLDAGLIDAHNALGGVFFQQGQFAKALAHFAAALRVEPSFAEAQFNWSLTMERLGNTAQAKAGYRKVLQLRPDSVPAATALAWILATTLDAGAGDGVEALRWAQRSCKLTAYRDPHALNVLAAAQAENGQLTEALQTARNALTLAQAMGRGETATVSQTLLDTFSAGRPYRKAAE